MYKYVLRFREPNRGDIVAPLSLFRFFRHPRPSHCVASHERMPSPSPPIGRHSRRWRSCDAFGLTSALHEERRACLRARRLERALTLLDIALPFGRPRTCRMQFDDICVLPHHARDWGLMELARQRNSVHLER